ncbi:ImmA/IrrE family metallo-endopeptidase [Enterococcus devriesei]|uniref:ImmA/IrrE family metallo-endopeptidase n=1 Tax=Enterococcus devriesei TaxID=319970 RepID=UPI0028E52857|nr:ImmA/IrrE family metallo-endopeptidase [Enterococcus devriesei]
MDEQLKDLSETIAEAYAVKFLADNVGGEIFLGGDIEQILADRAFLVYQSVDDPSYFGAALHLMGKHIIAINTNQPLRVRYYSAAHELWHLQFESGEIAIDEKQIDQERAADHFAAVVMLPSNLLKNIKNNFEKDDERLVFKIADLSSMPYQAVTRRLVELGYKLSSDLKSREEAEWIQVREQIDLVPSALDKADSFVQFHAFLQEVDEKVNKQELTLETAANLVKHIDAKKAEQYWKKRQEIVDDWDPDD